VCYRQAIKINPRSADAYANLGVALSQKGETKEAMDSWQTALEINPDQVYVQNNLAWLLATAPDAALRNGAKAVALAQRASQSSGGENPMILRTLAAACGEEGSYGLASTTARRALELAEAQNNGELAATLQKEIKLYEAGTPVRDASR
jgi:tetratricopeptide (TPR) repeat protein